MLSSPSPVTPTPPSPTTKESRNLYCLVFTSLFSLIFILSFTSSSFSTHNSSSTPYTIPKHRQKLFFNNPSQSSTQTQPHSPIPPSIAYFISGSNNDTHRILRLLYSIYHPRNVYLLHLELTAPQSQREDLALAIQSVPVFQTMKNVQVIGKADFAYHNGPSSVSSTLHGASILLLVSSSWDWFINLSASDYPLVTQDDLLHILSYLPKEFNFMNHSSDIGLREYRRMKYITVDPGLYLSTKSEIYYATQKRELPDAYKLFTDTAVFPVMIPFKLVCSMIQSGAAFGSKFLPDDPVLDHIDQKVLNRKQGKIVPGGWCLGESDEDPCTEWGDRDILRPGPGARRLERRLVELLSNDTFRSQQCIYQ
ncbi:hypothetical protein IFM89_028098 [Coptis chinensis]|uniref:Uncharacterized protein n=1 Tax=Coptis chinensis TaxID=261450 RepID=A0A835HYH1_9MAGN|nr:hypothetical protein IFM89_028098 [Coptis chinensis]